jgi:hypothetical protein
MKDNGSMKLAPLALLLAACAPEPPKTISLGSVPDSVREAAYVAAAAWCAVSDRTHWCPELVEAGGDARLTVGHFDAESGHAAAHQTGDMIEVSPGVLDGWPLDGIMTHEFGHFGIDGHVRRSPLMHARFEHASDLPVVVDDLAVAEWCKQQGC